MSRSEKELINAINHYKQSLLKYSSEDNVNESKLLYYIHKLHHYPIRIKHLEETGIGLVVNGLRKLGGEVADAAKNLITKWKKMVEEEEDDDEQEEEDSGQTARDDSETKLTQKESKHKNHSHREDKHKEKPSSSHKHHSERKHSSTNSKNEKIKHELPHIKTEKRKKDSDDEVYEESKSKKVRTEERHSSKNKHKRTSHSSDDESEEKHKHKSKDEEKSSSSKHRTEHKKSESSKHKDKHNKKKESSSKHEKTKNEEHKKKSGKKDISKTEKLMHSDGINSESGASFAEALGMLEPSTSKIVKKKISSPLRLDRNQSSSSSSTKTTKTENIPAALLKPPQSEPVDINLSSLLPTITPHYRPLGNLSDNLHQRHKASYDDEALSRVMSSKNQRTKVYSGNKSLWGYVPTLFELCTRILQDNIDALEYTGGVPYSILKPVLEKATPNQLFQMEHHNPYLIEDTDELWQLHCAREFKNKHREELETWREMYMRCLDEREAKLIALTANIKQSQDKSMPVRQTKLAYVDSFVKPPREIARKQAKNGTKNVITPSLKLSSLATAGPAGQIAVPNPGVRAVERSGGSSNVVQKPKKAPLMQKALAAIKNRYRR